MVARSVMKKRTGKIGAPPGTLVHVGEKQQGAPCLSVMRYSPELFEEYEATSVAQVRAASDQAGVTWINLVGLHHVGLIEELGTAFSIHPLVLEDILNTDHRPKCEPHDDFLFLVVKMLTYDAGQREIVSEQISLILGRGYVLSFQEKPGDLFEELRNRIRVDKGRVRRMGADYLAYRLLDTIVDHYFVILEQLGDHVETLEAALIDHPMRSLLHRIHHTKREIVLLRRSVWPLREAIGSLLREESGLMTPAVHPYLRDLYDHTIQIIDTIETFRDLITGMLDLYLSSVSNRMNEIMKVLTIMSTIFIPLTFLVGVYGMNFDYLPELHWHWAYFLLWGVMLAIAGGMFVFFRRKRWL